MYVRVKSKIMPDSVGLKKYSHALPACLLYLSFKITFAGVRLVAQWIKNQNSSNVEAVLILGFARWVKEFVVALPCSIGCRCGSDLSLLWL